MSESLLVCWLYGVITVTLAPLAAAAFRAASRSVERSHALMTMLDAFGITLLKKSGTAVTEAVAGAGAAGVGAGAEAGGVGAGAEAGGVGAGAEAGGVGAGAAGVGAGAEESPPQATREPAMATLAISWARRASLVLLFVDVFMNSACMDRASGIARNRFQPLAEQPCQRTEGAQPEFRSGTGLSRARSFSLSCVNAVSGN